MSDINLKINDFGIFNSITQHKNEYKIYFRLYLIEFRIIAITAFRT